MDALRQYILSVITAAFICGILSGLTEHSFAKEWIRLISGFLLVIAVFSPFLNIDFNSLSDFSLLEFQDAQSVAQLGKQASQDAVSDIIIKETEAYILDKASSLYADITVEIMLDANQLPEKVILYGSISPSSRRKLEEILESDLGITKERQIWTG